jgi:hypothetical protein
MSDWRDLPQGRELDRVVAERLGLITVNEAGQWQRVKERWNPDWIYPPAYSTDANAALALWADEHEQGAIAVLDFDGYSWTAYRKYFSEQFMQWVETEKQSADSPALAIVRAYLAWSERGA